MLEPQRDLDRKQRLYAGTMNVMRALINADGPMTRHELAEAVPCDLCTVDRGLAFLKESRFVRVAKWVRARGGAVSYWEVGTEPDAEVPPPRTKSERSAEWRRNGGDSHKARRMASQAKKIAKNSTFVGMLR